MGDVAKTTDAFLWSKSKLSAAFGIDRRTVSKRLDEYRVQPAEDRKGHPVYAVREAARAIFAPERSAGSVDLDDHPEMRKAWYQSENERIKFEVAIRSLIPQDVYVREMSLFAKNVASVLDSVCDVLERDAGVDPDALDIVEKTVDSLREALYQQVVMAEAEDSEEIKG